MHIGSQSKIACDNCNKKCIGSFRWNPYCAFSIFGFFFVCVYEIKKKVKTIQNEISKNDIHNLLF